MPSYEVFATMPDVTELFTTGRGSTYARFADGTTIRDRSGADHLHNKSVGLQPRSHKTVFMSHDAVGQVSGLFQNPEIPTSIMPEKTPNGGWVAKVVVSHDEGGFRKGQVLAQAPFSNSPTVGSYPVEIMHHISPLGSSGDGVHFGTKIVELVKGGAILRAMGPVSALQDIVGYAANKRDAEVHLTKLLGKDGVPTLSEKAISAYGELVAGARIEQGVTFNVSENLGFGKFIEWAATHKMPIDALVQLNPTSKSKEQIEEALLVRGGLLSQAPLPEVTLAQTPNIAPQGAHRGLV